MKMQKNKSTILNVQFWQNNHVYKVLPLEKDWKDGIWEKFLEQ